MYIGFIQRGENMWYYPSSNRLLPLVRYPLWLTTVNRYHPRDSKGNFFFTTKSKNVSVVRCGMFLVTILLLDFILIHWIQWIQWKSFRENSVMFNVATRERTPNKPLCYSKIWIISAWNNDKMSHLWQSLEKTTCYSDTINQKMWIIHSTVKLLVCGENE